MENKRFKISMEDIRKYEVLQKLVAKEIKGYQAATLLGYSSFSVPSGVSS